LGGDPVEVPGCEVVVGLRVDEFGVGHCWEFWGWCLGVEDVWV
jgi:hypothetical protein